MTGKPWDIEGKWSVSHFCYEDGIRKNMPNLPKKATIRDITFREGDDCIGLRISVPDKVKMLAYGVEMGIKEVDTGGPSLHPHQFAFSRAIKDAGIPVRCTGRFFANSLTTDYHYDIEKNVEAGSDNLRIICNYLSEKTIYEQAEKLPRMIEYAHQCGLPVCVGMSDVTRAPMKLMDVVYDTALAAGVDKVGIFDTFGVGSPQVMKYIAEYVKAKLPQDMHFMCHMHNTFGLATANSLACVEGGCDEIDGAVNGYGDEAGNASMEECAVALEALYGIDTGLKMHMMKGYSRMGEEYGHVYCQPHKAIVGDNAFLRPMVVWGGHDMARESWMSHASLDPDYVGADSSVVFGPEATLDDEPIALKFKELGIDYTAEDIIKVRNAVEAKLQEEVTVKHPRYYLTEAQYDELVKGMFNK